jgi:hypothetical protein
VVVSSGDVDSRASQNKIIDHHAHIQREFRQKARFWLSIALLVRTQSGEDLKTMPESVFGRGCGHGQRSGPPRPTAVKIDAIWQAEPGFCDLVRPLYRRTDVDQDFQS